MYKEQSDEIIDQGFFYHSTLPNLSEVYDIEF